MAANPENHNAIDIGTAANDDFPDPSAVASLGLRSTELGQSLQAALHSLFQDEGCSKQSSASDGEEKGDGDEPKRRQTKTAGMIRDDDHEIQESIQNAFGQAFADTMCGKTSASTNTAENKDDGDFTAAAAPRVLMRGRLDHYNRVGANWRIVADGIQLYKRKPLPKKRKRTDRVSLWDVAGDNGKQPPETIEGTLEILAYNDV